MGAVGVLAGIAVGIALVAAGVFKLIDGPGWPKMAADMGVPTWLARLVPFVEIAVGAALASQLARPWPAIAALALLVVFTLVIATRLLDGSRPPCACFGTRSTRPLGRYHVVRNLVMIALAVVAAVWA
ncbi:MAG: MauE/DoxX family redox-associated membrane protein [Desertimonas sp.]